MSKAYINFKKYGIEWVPEERSCIFTCDGYGTPVKNFRVLHAYGKDGCEIDLDGTVCKAVPKHRETASELTVTYQKEEGKPLLALFFRMDEKGLRFTQDGTYTSSVVLAGDLWWGDHEQSETMACAIGRDRFDMRSAYGPAACAADNALFDRDTDTALVFSGENEGFRLRYDWGKGCYTFTFRSAGTAPDAGVTMKAEARVYEKLFRIDYRRLEPNPVFPRVPVGFMTWYALQFSADEEKILKNTAWQKENLSEYGANAIWVDAEWRQRDNSGLGRDGMDNYHPDTEHYPDGMRYIADKIREAGFVPAIWMSPTVETRENEFMKACPDMVSMKQTSWCGRYWMDCSHPEFLNVALKRQIGLLKDEWGYEAIKWDVMTETIRHTDDCHDDLYDSGKSTREIMLQMFAKAREYVGKDYPLLACFASGDREMDAFLTSFDAARIGGDVFTWKHFADFVLGQLGRYYSFHKVICNTDPDNVVLRPAFSTYDQAVTRAVIVSALGLPFTFGDDLTELPADRVDIIKRTIPPLNVRPMDIRYMGADRCRMVINTYIEKPWERYLVSSVINLTGAPVSMRLDLYEDMHLDPAEKGYHIFEYWGHTYYGCVGKGFDVTLRPYETKVFAVREAQVYPQILSTSRHIGQGAEDLLAVRYDPETRILSGSSEVIGGVPYEITFTCGDGSDPIIFEYINEIMPTAEFRSVGSFIWTVTFRPEKSGEFAWRVPFSRYGGNFGKYHAWD